MKRVIWAGALAFGLAAMAVSALQVSAMLKANRQSETTYEQLAAQYTAPLPPAAESGHGSSAANAPAQNTLAAGAQPQPALSVDFAALQRLNPEIVGWLYCAELDISLPVTQGQDNQFYLSHLADGSCNTHGAIFAEAANRAGFMDGNTILYGHNMQDGSMFTPFAAYSSRQLYQKDLDIRLYTPAQNYRLLVFAGYTTLLSDADTYQIIPEPGDELLAYEEACAARSDFTSETMPAPDERIVLLSTCAHTWDSDERYVLFAALRPCD